MKGEKLFDALNDIREDYIDEAAPKKRQSPALMWGSLAAGLILVAAGAAMMLPETSTADPSLPKLTVEAGTAAMGYEGYLAYDIDELTDANPWSGEADIDTLPVWRNLNRKNFDGSADSFPREEMESRLTEMAEALQLENYTITDNSPDEEEKKAITDKFASAGEEVPEEYFAPTALLIEAEGVTIEAESDLTVTVQFDPAVTLTGGILPDDADYEVCLAAAEELAKEYAAVIGMDDPAIEISGGDRDIYGVQRYDICFYEGSDELTEAVAGYNFDRIVFHRDDEGKLFLIRKTERDLSEKIGDYPVITEKEAEKLLCDGSYITSVPYEMPGRKYIRKAELVYRTDPSLEVFMPYYRFYVELPEGAHGELNDYGAYYVPAVEESCLTALPEQAPNFGC